MRVLHVLNELKPSGAETMLKNAAPHWRRLGVECEILATGASAGPYANTLREAGYRVHHLPSRRRIGYFLDYSRFVRKGGYSVVHQHAEGMSYWFGLATLLARARLVRTIHSNFLFEGVLRWRRALQRRHLGVLGARFVAIAPGVRENERSRFGIDAQLVWNWIDTANFNPLTTEQRVAARARWGLSEGDIVFLTVGNCAPAKNHSLLIEAIARLPHTPRVRYLHVGLEDEVCTERQLAEQLNISEHVSFTGWIPNAKDALAAADLFIMPSKYEGLGIAAIEALGMGLPVLLTRVDGLRDLGALYPDLIYTDPNLESLVQSLAEFCALTKPARTKLSEGYAEITEKFFGMERGVNEYVEIYKSLLGLQVT
jgi:glycosyltransferase involved in cell wall biosynthesis